MIDIIAVVSIMEQVVQYTTIQGDDALGLCLDFYDWMAVNHPAYQVSCIRVQEVAQ